MSVEELSCKELNRHLKITLAASELETNLAERLVEIQKTASIKGFRAGKVPVNHLKRLYGKNITAELIDKKIKEVVQSTLDNRNEISAKQPEVILPEDEKQANDIVDLKQDLVFEIKYEVIPHVEVDGLEAIKIEKPVIEIKEAEIEESLKNLSQHHKSFVAKQGVAKKGDQVTMDFVGYIDEVAFEGGTANDAKLEIGSGTYIPGFEDQLIGKKAGDNCHVDVTFPTDYGQKTLAGKNARFEVVVKEIGESKAVVIDDKFAESLGLKDLNKLKEAIEEQLKREHGTLANTIIKRRVLDTLDKKYQFDLPESLYNDEIRAIANELQKQDNNQDSADEQTKETSQENSIENVEKNYGTLAKRRVRLGIVLSQIAKKANISVSDKELQDEIRRQASQYPGQEKQFVELIQKNPAIQSQFSAPILEQKTVDYIVELAEVKENKISVEELQDMYKKIEEEDELSQAKSPSDDNPVKKKASVKKTSSKKKKEDKTSDA